MIYHYIDYQSLSIYIYIFIENYIDVGITTMKSLILLLGLPLSMNRESIQNDQKKTVLSQEMGDLFITARWHHMRLNHGILMEI